MWRNWSGELECTPAAEVHARTEAEVAEAVTAAREAGRGPVRVAGAGHSFTPLVLTTGTLLRLGRLGGVLDADRSSGLVRVGAGATIAQLNADLDALGLAFENLGDIDVQAIAGALATATHGTGARRPSLSAQVEALELVASDGTVHRCSRDDDPDLWRAVRVSLGALGVLTAVTLRTVPAFTLRRVDRPEPLEEVLGSLDERIAAHEHFELFVFPYADQALTRTTDRVDGPPEPPSALARRRERFTTNQGWELLLRLGRRFPSSIPLLNRLATRLAGTSVKVDRSHACFASPRLVRFTETEWSIPRAAAADVVRAVRAWCDERRYPVSFPFELRFVAPDDADLATAHGRESAYVAVHAYTGMPFEELFAAVQAIALAHDGRPHWGKRHELAAAQLAPRYPRWDAFQAQRARLDPDGLFANAHVQKVLGPVGVRQGI